MDLVKTVKYGIGAIMVAGVIACGVGYAVNDLDGTAEHVKAETTATANKSIDSQDTDNTVQHDVARTVDENGDINGSIAEAHMYLNEYTGYGKLDTVDDEDTAFWDNVRGNLTQVANDITVNLDSVTDKDERQDLANFVELVSIIKKHNDKTALLYAHRIMHDLDINENNYARTEQQFDVTHVKGYGTEIDNYVQENNK
jgi:hypothetical protein